MSRQELSSAGLSPKVLLLGVSPTIVGVYLLVLKDFMTWLTGFASKRIELVGTSIDTPAEER